MKKVLVLMLTLLMSFSVFANGAKENKAPSVDLSAPVKLTLWTHDDPNRSVLEKGLIEEFCKANPNVTVEYQTYPSGKMEELLTVAFSAGEGPDIFNRSQGFARNLVLEGQLSALNPEWIGLKSIKDFTSRYIPASLDAVLLDGNYYGMPLEYTNLCCYLNKKMFVAAGLDPVKDIPKTWEDMMRVSEKIAKRNGEIITTRGFDFRYSSYYTMEMLPLVEQMGGTLVSADWKKAVENDEAWLKFFKYMQQWGPNGKNLGGPTYTAGPTAFQQDNNSIAMADSGLYQEARMKAANPNFYNSDDWMVIPFPQWKDAVKQVPTHVSCHYYMVNGDIAEANQIWAWRLVDFLLSHSEDYLNKVNIVQPVYALFESESFKSIPYSDVFASDLEKATLNIYGPNTSAITDRMKQAVEAVMLQGQKPEDVLKTLRRQVQEIIDEK